MDNDTKKLVQTEFLAFVMKAFAYLNKGSDLGQDKYLKLLAERLARVAAGKTKRLVVSLPPLASPGASVWASHSMRAPTRVCATNWVTTHRASRCVAASIAMTVAATPVPP